MNTPAIILGDPNSILRLPKAGIRKSENWLQMDSDIIAHFIQVQKQIQLSRWNTSKLSLSEQGDKVLESSFPEFEDFVYAAVYLRQLIAKKDSLLKDAADRYCQFVDCDIRPVWIQHEVTAFENDLERPTFLLQKYKLKDLFDAFIYGAALLHKIPDVNDKKRKMFLEIYDNEPRHKVLLALNMALRVLMNHVGSISVVIYRDYSHWLHDYKLPLPDSRWHDKLFEIKQS